MKYDNLTIEFVVRKIVKKRPVLGPLILDFYVAVPSYSPLLHKKEESVVVNPLLCVTENHLLPTDNGFKKASEIKAGDTIILTLNCMC